MYSSHIIICCTHIFSLKSCSPLIRIVSSRVPLKQWLYVIVATALSYFLQHTYRHQISSSPNWHYTQRKRRNARMSMKCDDFLKICKGQAWWNGTKLKGKNDLCPNLTHYFQVLYLRSPLKKTWYIYIFPITKMDKVGDKTFTT